MTPVLGAEALTAFFDEAFPQVGAGGFVVEDVSPGEAVIRLETEARHLRPGGTVSGPTLFALCDTGAYAVILAHVGPQALAVTTSAHVDFLVRPAPGALSCRTRLLKLGRRLAVTEAHVTDEAGAIVARASLTYSLPPKVSG